MKKTNTFIVPYDSASRMAKVSHSLSSWKRIFPTAKYLNRELSDLLPYMVEAEVYKSIYEDSIPLMIGGDHSLTYHSCKALTNYYGPINILVFDAHHDSYPSYHLNHYTVFYHIQKHLKSKICLIGCRKDPEESLILNTEIKSPCYLSIDLDYFSPNFINSVVDPITVSDDAEYSFESFLNYINQLDCKIIGGDIVEWGGEQEGTAEYKYVERVSKKVVNIMDNLSWLNRS